MRLPKPPPDVEQKIIALRSGTLRIHGAVKPDATKPDPLRGHTSGKCGGRLPVQDRALNLHRLGYRTHAGQHARKGNNTPASDPARSTRDDSLKMFDRQL